MRILVVTKDIAEYNIYHKVVAKLRELGHTVIVVAEGLSMDLWVKTGEAIWQGLSSAEHIDAPTKMRRDIDPDTTIRELAPDVVMCGLGGPINLGQSFGLAANVRGVRLGVVEDIWHCHKRSTAVPDFVCTLDEYGADSVRKYYADIQVKVFITGSPVTDNNQAVEADPIAKEVDVAYFRTILIGGQGPSTTPMLEGLALALTSGAADFLIIPRLHPKLLADPANAGMANGWRESIYKMQNRYNNVLWTPPSVTTQSLLPVADVVVSIYSNLLLEGLMAGALPFSWTSDIGREEMAKTFNGLTSFPAATLGAVLEVETPEDFNSKLWSFDKSSRDKFIQNARQTLKLDGKATERVVEAILSI